MITLDNCEVVRLDPVVTGKDVCLVTFQLHRYFVMPKEFAGKPRAKGLEKYIRQRAQLCVDEFNEMWEAGTIPAIKREADE